MDSLFSAVGSCCIKITSILYWGCFNSLLRLKDITATATTISSPPSLSILSSSTASSIQTKDTQRKGSLYLQTMGVLQPLMEHSLLILVTTFLVYQVTLVVYRLYFSPLAKFPGPKLAAASLWYVDILDISRPGVPRIGLGVARRSSSRERKFAHCGIFAKEEGWGFRSLRFTNIWVDVGMSSTTMFVVMDNLLSRSESCMRFMVCFFRFSCGFSC